ncbi:NINE protein [Bacillus horti]|uniref:TM2 domain-containing membrane protein YozV n=1 Tax=Caldalkalibacillus horti TaxID=77523 RepID=A0ABT9VTI6_9BACI|nr:NINE protein [Bacillus horti]MDQ0164303.1 TM2 domain-containing membrane protein YozV [Bacillus horti]
MSMEAKSKLDIQQLLVFESEYRKRTKSHAVSFLLFFIGFFGLHRFYLGDTAMGVLQVLVYVVLVILYYIAIIFELIILLIPLGILLLLLVGLFIYDLFTLKKKVDKMNQKIEDQLLSEILSEAQREY